MNVLFLTTVLPSLRRTGGEVASAAFVEALRAEGHEVTVVGYRRPGMIEPTGTGEIEAAKRPIETRLAGVRPALWLLMAGRLGLPYSAAKYVSRSYRRLAARLVDERRPALAVIDHAQTGWLLRRGVWALPYVYLAHNIEQALYTEQSAAARPGATRWLYGREARAAGSLEARLSRDAAAVWALTADDAGALEAMAPAARVHSFDVPPVAAANATAPAAEVDVAVMGTWTWRANAVSLEWFFVSVYPRLPRGVSIAVGGVGAEHMRSRYPNVSVAGAVEDPLRFLQRARVIAVPSVAGSGVQVKTLDAIASGRPVVATSVALRGVERPPATVSVGDRPETFATLLADALDDARAAGSPGIAADWVAQRHAAFRRQLRAAMEELRG
jgi:hypothetical protein